MDLYLPCPAERVSLFNRLIRQNRTECSANVCRIYGTWNTGALISYRLHTVGTVGFIVEKYAGKLLCISL